MAGERGQCGGNQGGRGGVQSEGQPLAGDRLQLRPSRRRVRGGGFAGCSSRGQMVEGLHEVNKGTKWDLQKWNKPHVYQHTTAPLSSSTNDGAELLSLSSLTLVGVEPGVLLPW